MPTIGLCPAKIRYSSVYSSLRNWGSLGPIKAGGDSLLNRLDSSSHFPMLLKFGRLVHGGWAKAWENNWTGDLRSQCTVNCQSSTEF